MKTYETFHRRHFVRTVVTAGLAASMSTNEMSTANAQQSPADSGPGEILAKLMEGNRRFVEGANNVTPSVPADFARAAQGQGTQAAILGCSDSRVPPEFVFDQPIGSLFDLRVAGNIVGSGPIVKGSLEFAVAELGARLIVVMGHSECGACKAALEHIKKDDVLPGAIGGLVDYIRPVAALVDEQGEDRLAAVAKANALQNARRIAGLEPTLSEYARSGQVKVVAAYYELSSGQVELLNP